MRCLPAAALACLLIACPERKVPERGIELVYTKKDAAPVRPVVEKRLAQAKVKARLSEDDGSLSVRVPEDGDVARVKALLSRVAKLEMCEELEDEASALCSKSDEGEVALEKESLFGASYPGGPTVPARGVCFFSGRDRAAVVAAAKAATSGRVLLEAYQEGRVRTFFAPKTCFSPGVDEARALPSQFGPGAELNLTFDPPSGKEFAALTGRLVGRRLLVVLDGDVALAPLVQERIAGGSARITQGAKGSQADLELLGAALVGGALEGVSLTAERPFGPPSLTR